jgi:hypothetical protein
MIDIDAIFKKQKKPTKDVFDLDRLFPKKTAPFVKKEKVRIDNDYTDDNIINKNQPKIEIHNHFHGMPNQGQPQMLNKKFLSMFESVDAQGMPLKMASRNTEQLTGFPDPYDSPRPLTRQKSSGEAKRILNDILGE